MTEDTLPSLWVNPEDFERARNIITEAERRNQKATKANWQCTECDEVNPISFEVCWNCKNDRAHSPTIAIHSDFAPTSKLQTMLRDDSRANYTLVYLLIAVCIPLFGAAVFYGLRLAIPDGPSAKFSRQANEFLWGKANAAAVEMMKRGQYEDAIGQLSDVRDQGKDTVFTYLLEGYLHSKIYDFDEALETLNRAIAKQPEYYRGYMLRGGVLSQVSREKAAAADFQRAAELIPTDETVPLVIHDQAKIALQLGFTDKAEALIKRALKSKLNDTVRSMIFELQADIAMSKGHSQRAVKLLRKSLAADGLHDDRLAKLGWAYLKSGDKEHALTNFNNALAINVRNADALAGRAAVSSQRSDCTNAVNDLTNAVILNGQNPSYYFDRARCYFIGDDIDRADADFRNAIDLNSSFRTKRDRFIESLIGTQKSSGG